MANPHSNALNQGRSLPSPRSLRCSPPLALASLLIALASCATTPPVPPKAPVQAPGNTAAAAVQTQDAVRQARVEGAQWIQGAVDLEVVDGIVLAIHGGAGTILREDMTPELDQAYREALAGALLAGYQVLSNGGDSVAAVEAALRPMEDSHLFNAGRGAVLNDDGEVEMDASIMVGQSGMAGAVAGARTTRHPISLARKVMDESPHVLLSGPGADVFGTEQGLETKERAWFVTPHRKEQLRLLKAKEERRIASAGLNIDDHKFGTVGAVALDERGHLAAGTTTGGMARKAWGRIGDSPIIGAGTWASDATCAVSCTGHGEFFIRKAIAHQIHSRMAFGGAGIGGAARATVLEELPKGGGSGGCVALDAKGRMAAPFTTPGMYRGWIDSEGRVTVRIHADERR